ncbi:MAG: class I SAM-dependent methyltransferase [Candidatus ainarchaeum sp.]|nr:class I SAM-dependent methyltransferase [Candidatus ainarchaeum sp.]MDD3976354.1 class I SAM-dependent methyltransferase [Candidatus ainarchaeum sp.]
MDAQFQKNIWNDYFKKNKITDNFLKSRYEYLFKKLKNLKSTGRLLEIGYGNGYLLNLAKNYEVYGTDICTTNNNQNFVIFNSDITKKINWESNYFDLIVASEVLEHIDKKKIPQSLIEIKRVLKKGGFFIGTVPLNEELSSEMVLCPYCNKTFHKWGHEDSYSIDKLYKLFLQYGFEIIEIKPVFIFSKYNGLWKNKRLIYAYLNYYFFRNNLNSGNIYFCIKKK